MWTEKYTEEIEEVLRRRLFEVVADSLYEGEP